MLVSSRPLRIILLSPGIPLIPDNPLIPVIPFTPDNPFTPGIPPPQKSSNITPQHL